MKKEFFTAVFAVAATVVYPQAAGVTAAGRTEPVRTDSVRIVELESIQILHTRADSKTPVAYSDLKRDDIAALNYGQDIPYLLSVTPSVVATSDAGAGVGYTGIRIRGVDASRINVTSNGVPMNDAESHTMFWVNVPDIASSVEDIQIQRGVGTSTNGAGAFGGSINLRTESPQSEAGAEVSLSYGSFDTRRATVKANSGLINEHWAFGARLSGISSDGYIERASTEMRSWLAHGGYYGRGTVVKALVFGGTEKTYHAWDGISRQMLSDNRRYNPCGEISTLVRDDVGRAVLDNDGLRQYEVSGFYKDQTDNYAQNHIQLILNQRLGARWKMNATLHYTTGAGYYEEYKNEVNFVEYGLAPYQTSEPDRADYLVSDGDGFPVQDHVGNYTVDRSNIVRQKKMENTFKGVVASFNYAGERLDVTLGGAANQYLGSHFGLVTWVRNYVGPLDPAHEYYRNRSDKADANVFARATYELTSGLHVYADLQYRVIRHRIWGINDKYDYRIGSRGMQPLDVDRAYHFFNPKAGVSYRSGGHRVYGSFAAAGKEPTRNNFTDVIGGAVPRVEQLFDYELGYEYRSPVFSAGVNFYYMDYKDQLVLTGQTNEIGEPMSANVPSSYRAGVELTAGVRLTKWLDWSVNTTLSRNIIRDYIEYLPVYATGAQQANALGDTQIAYSPSVIAGSVLTARFGAFAATLQSQYVGSQYVTNSMQDGAKDDDGEWEPDPLKLDAYFVNNLRLNYTFELRTVRSLTVGVAVNNIFNSMYCSNGWGYSALVSDGAGGSYRFNEMGYYPQAGVNFMANVTLSF